jgi:hypothetical protein
LVHYHLHTSAKGNGPGEFTLAFGVIADGDDLLVPDVRNRRVSVFGADRGYVRSYPTPVFGYSLRGWQAVIDSVGRVLAMSSGAPRGTGSSRCAPTTDR